MIDKVNLTDVYLLKYKSSWLTIVYKGIRCKDEREILENELEHYVNFCLRMDHE